MKLLYGAAPPTHTSMKANEGIVRTKWSTVEGMESEKGEKDEAEGPGVSSRVVA